MAPNWQIINKKTLYCVAGLVSSSPLFELSYANDSSHDLVVSWCIMVPICKLVRSVSQPMTASIEKLTGTNQYDTKQKYTYTANSRREYKYYTYIIRQNITILLCERLSNPDRSLHMDISHDSKPLSHIVTSHILSTIFNCTILIWQFSKFKNKIQNNSRSFHWKCHFLFQHPWIYARVINTFTECQHLKSMLDIRLATTKHFAHKFFLTRTNPYRRTWFLRSYFVFLRNNIAYSISALSARICSHISSHNFHFQYKLK